MSRLAIHESESKRKDDVITLLREEVAGTKKDLLEKRRRFVQERNNKQINYFLVGLYCIWFYSLQLLLCLYMHDQITVDIQWSKFTRQ